MVAEIGREYILKTKSEERKDFKATVKLVKEDDNSYLFRNISGAEEFERRHHLPSYLLSDDEKDCFWLEKDWFPDKFYLEQNTESISSWFADYCNSRKPKSNICGD